MRWRLLPSMAVFTQNPFCATYFFSAGKKSKQKSPLASYVLHPIISEI
jgi:hypothetical protein